MSSTFAADLATSVPMIPILFPHNHPTKQTHRSTGLPFGPGTARWLSSSCKGRNLQSTARLSAHRNPNISLLEGWGIIHSITRHCMAHKSEDGRRESGHGSFHSWSWCSSSSLIPIKDVSPCPGRGCLPCLPATISFLFCRCSTITSLSFGEARANTTSGLSKVVSQSSSV